MKKFIDDIQEIIIDIRHERYSDEELLEEFRSNIKMNSGISRIQDEIILRAAMKMHSYNGDTLTPFTEDNR
jgi:hypothetical protein